MRGAESALVDRWFVIDGRAMRPEWMQLAFTACNATGEGWRTGVNAALRQFIVAPPSAGNSAEQLIQPLAYDSGIGR